jgi:hypothetical protein
MYANNAIDVDAIIAHVDGGTQMELPFEPQSSPENPPP